MKFIFTLAVLTIFVTGCGASRPSLSYTDEISGVETVDDGFVEVMEQLEDVEEGKTPEVEKEEVVVEEEVYTSAIIRTTIGDIQVGFYWDVAPLAVENFMKLAKEDFYDGITFHRVIPGFMIQGGDPLSKDNDPTNDGMGGPGYTFPDEQTGKPLVSGSLAMANAGPNTNGSQFFIVTGKETPWLDGKHTNFGYVMSGMDIVHIIEAVAADRNSRPLQDVVIKDVELVK
ncbi:MAG: peptidylprolyl isomerase [Candidatus Magasanikbacteria bacterium]|jgi:cyclophilin family peptidyl-prolyl cis-trans isomerase|nr:peptidylprolyl isomerase [Candidatus Magasanikbacteria bacterium]MBT4071213.1 peptidylprolyl isomerase [Candidatus Magasanikbacteria bacterium]